MNDRFQNAVRSIEQKVPPIWFMRQAGRYHSHYQKLRKEHSFMELCKDPNLAAKVALGPIEDFDFDVAILFSDLLFPLEALGFGLSYDEGPPKLEKKLSEQLLRTFPSIDTALRGLAFQREAVLATKEILPKSKSLIGFVGGPATLFAYAVGESKGERLIDSKKDFHLFDPLCEILVPLLKENIALQLEGGAEAVMIFDTFAGNFDPITFNTRISGYLTSLSRAFPCKLGYYAKGAPLSHYEALNSAPFAGFGFDHRHFLPDYFRIFKGKFLQGNFDEAMLHVDPSRFPEVLDSYLKPFLELTPSQRLGWVCGLGHGVTPNTPEVNVRHFISRVREVFA